MKDLIKLLKDNKHAALGNDNLYSDIDCFIDTGSYALNALYSGSLFKGLPGNKISLLAGPSTTGKSFFLISIINHFLQMNKKHHVVFFESEGALTSDDIKKRICDPKRILLIPTITIEQLRTESLILLEHYLTHKDSDDRKFLFAVDSLGMLSTNKEIGDTRDGSDKRDMTSAQLKRGFFRIITMKLSEAKVPLIMTNHTYDEQKMYGKRVMSGGQGAMYAGTNVLFLSRKDDKESGNGVFITCQQKKSRMTKMGLSVTTRVDYDTGLDRYYGLVDLGLECGYLKNVSRKIEFPNGIKEFRKTIEDDHKKYFTDDVLKEMDVEIQKAFCYGMPDTDELIEEMVNPSND